MKRIFTCIAAAALLSSARVVSAGSLKMSHVRPQGASIDTELRAFAETVASATNGGV